jgi:hypothetical protein
MMDTVRDAWTLLGRARVMVLKRNEIQRGQVEDAAILWDLDYDFACWDLCFSITIE